MLAQLVPSASLCPWVVLGLPVGPQICSLSALLALPLNLIRLVHHLGPRPPCSFGIDGIHRPICQARTPAFSTRTGAPHLVNDARRRRRAPAMARTMYTSSVSVPFGHFKMANTRYFRAFRRPSGAEAVNMHVFSNVSEPPGRFKLRKAVDVVNPFYLFVGSGVLVGGGKASIGS